MTIETKFNYGDTAFMLTKNKVHTVKIERVITDTGEHLRKDDGEHYFSTMETDVKYDIRLQSGYIDRNIPEARLFATKQELINSL